MINNNKHNGTIIGFLGCMGSGKSTCTSHVVENYNYEEKFFAKKLKEICKILFDFKDEQLYGNKKQEIDDFWGISARSAMQFVGTDLFRLQAVNLIQGIGDNFWVRTLEKELVSNKNYVISDCRMQNEVDFIKSKGGYVIKIIQTNINKDETSQHITESELDCVHGYDYVIYNDGSLEDLFKNVDEIMYKIGIQSV